MFRKTFLLLFVVVVTIVGLSSAHGHYGRGWDEEHYGAQVWSVELGATGQLAALQRIADDIDVLRHSDSNAVLYIRPGNLDDANHLIQTLGLKYEVIVEDFSRYLKEMHLVEESNRALSRAVESCTSSSCPRPLLQSYMSFDQIEWFLQSLAAQYPDNVQLSEQGETTEGRSLWLVKVAQAGAGASEEAVFVEGGAHAREWVSFSTVLNILMAQVEDCVATTICDATFYFMPSINPDGYVHTWTSDRLWRKNRSLPPASSSSYGTDINRNFGYKWGYSGASTNPGSQIYKGPSAFSTPEASAVRDAVQAIVNDANTNLVLYISYHSYGQLILYPWSYSGSVVPPSRAENIEAAEAYSNAVKAVNNVNYEVLQSADLYPAAGVSDDYAMSLGVEQSFTVELQDTSSFILSSSQIEPTYLENWAGFQAMVAYVLGTNTTGTGSKSLLSGCAKG